jgi:SmpA / OmlA family
MEYRDFSKAHLNSFRLRVCGLLLLSLVIFNGCATIGRDFAVTEVPKIQLGKTTQAEIMSMFGSPWRTGMEDGRQTWTYGKYHYSLFSEASAQDLVVRFDGKGFVSSYTYNTTEHPQ